MTTRDVIVN